MKKFPKISILLFPALFILFTALSCMERIEGDGIYGGDPVESIIFSASLQSDKTPDVKSFSPNFISQSCDWELELSTKVAISTKLEGSPKILGYLYTDQFTDDTPQWGPLTNSPYTFNGDELLSPAAVRWGIIPSEYNMLRVYVCTPNEFEGGVFPTATATGAPKIEYTLPSDLSKQTDIITAVKDVSANYKRSIPLTFNHALTALKFRMGFACTVKSVAIKGVYNKGTYTIGNGWSGLSAVGTAEYTLNFGTEGKSVAAEEELNSDENVMMMIPQQIPAGAVIEVVYDDDKTISAPLEGIKWEEGKLITYTLHKKEAMDYIYVDLAAGHFTLAEGTYAGKVYINNGTATADVTGTHSPANKYYVYQSSASNYTFTGWSGAAGSSTFTLPVYKAVYLTVGGKEVLWSDYITNNTAVTKVIIAWDNKPGADDNGTSSAGAVRNVGRNSTKNRIHITGNVGTCDLYIDNIYSSYQHKSTGRSTGGIAYIPAAPGDNDLRINIIGDNRVGCVHYSNSSGNGNSIVFQGEGSLTVADADWDTEVDSNKGEEQCDTSFYANHWNAAIGNNDSAQEAYGIVFNSGVIFAGTTKAENCTAIGGGGNGYGGITINGGVITAVATTTGTAIGGGIGFNSAGGVGNVTINGGNVYAYNHANQWGIPSSAIGGAGSSLSSGSTGTVTINGGNIYAQSALGTAIGGGSSRTKKGGDARVYIYDGIVISRSLAQNSAGIGGGSTCTGGGTLEDPNGGNATIVVGKDGGGIPILRTGSIGGGATNATGGKIGSANITVNKGDVQAQFVMAASDDNTFTMNGGTIRNSYSTDAEYKHIQPNGGAVYMEQGTFVMHDGTIQNCSAVKGGAIYMKGTTATSFTMNGGVIQDCISDSDGGALYLEGGTVTLNGGRIYNNLAEQGNGGGICIVGGNFHMPVQSSSEGAIIDENAAYSRNSAGNGSGGGIYVTSSTSNVIVDILQGKIINNTSDRYGGGLSVDLGSATGVSAEVTVGAKGSTSLTDPIISGNRTSIRGGGLYVSGEKANIIINGGKILENRTSGYVSNPDVANEGGMVTLNGGDVTHQTVTYMPNGGEINGNASIVSVSQKIVTATNSLMVVPGTFARTGWRLTGWHTRPDGDDTKGKFYPTGAVLNISTDLTLYAQWEE